MALRSLLLALILALPLTMVCQNSASTKSDKTAKAADNATNNAGQQLTPSDKSFLKALVKEDMSEINLAKLALKKTSDPDVKQYAQTKILGADPEMRDGAEKILQNNGVKPPDTPSARKHVMYDKLSKKSGKLFDDAYMNYEADQQKADVLLVQRELKTTNDSNVKSYVEKEKTPVADAASAAQNISKKISSSMTNYRQKGANPQGSNQGGQSHRP